MKLKRIILAISIGLLSLLGYSYFFNTTKIYMGIVNPSVIDKVDITVRLNKNHSFRDTLFNGLFNYKIKTVNMRWGKNQIIVSSSRTKSALEKEIFLYPFENVIIVYCPPNGDSSATFEIGLIRGDFVYE